MFYGEVLPNHSNEVELREEIEWSNFWIDNANEEKKDRILIVGDSTARMIRSTLSKMSSRPVDLLATSSGLHDSLFINQMDCFFKSEYRYDIIIVQLGHHARIGADGGGYNSNDFQRYEDDFCFLLQYLTTKAKSIIVESVFYSVIPSKFWWIKKIFRIKEKYDIQVNEHKAQKNRIMERVSKKLGIKWLDINSFMINKGKKYYHKDHIHYEKSADSFIAQRMLEEITDIQK